MGETTKKPREMSAKRFATAKLSAKTTVEGYISAHRSFLQKFPVVASILEAYDNKDLLPTVALNTIQSALMSYYLDSQIKAAEAKMEKAAEAAGASKDRYQVSLYCKVMDKDKQISIQVGTVREVVGYRIRTPLGDMVVKTKDEADGHVVLEKLVENNPAVWDVPDFGSAMRLADRRLFQREDSVYAEIVNTFDRPIPIHIQRGDAMARFLRQPKSAVSRVRGMSTKSLGFGAHASPTRDVWHLKH